MGYVAGVDLSLSSTAVVIIEADTGEICFKETGIGYSLPKSAPWWDRLLRHEVIAEDCGRILDQFDPVDCLVFEGPSLGSKGGVTFDIGGMMYNFLREVGYYDPCPPMVVEVPPSNLKKFATGSGKSPKNLVMAHVQKRWDHIFEDDNLTDAFVLCEIGRALLGKTQVKLPEAHLTALDKVKIHEQDTGVSKGRRGCEDPEGCCGERGGEGCRCDCEIHAGGEEG